MYVRGKEAKETLKKLEKINIKKLVTFYMDFM